LFSAPAMRSYPYAVFSRAIRRTNSVSSRPRRDAQDTRGTSSHRTFERSASMPSQDSVQLGYASNLSQSLRSESFTNFGQCRSLRIGQPEPSGRCARRILFSAAKYSLLQQDLIRYSRHVREQPRHLRVLHGKAHHSLPLFPTPSDILTLRGQVNWIKRPLRRLYRTYALTGREHR
jgi:hypothetical protein